MSGVGGMAISLGRECAPGSVLPPRTFLAGTPAMAKPIRCGCDDGNDLMVGIGLTDPGNATAGIAPPVFVNQRHHHRTEGPLLYAVALDVQAGRARAPWMKDSQDWPLSDSG